jgi:general secretion pathway protein J
MTAPPAISGSRLRGCAGFTLIEVLIAATLLSLLAMLLMGGVHFGTRVMESGLQRTDQTMRLSTAFGFLRNRLEQVQPLEQMAGAKENRAVVFEGGVDRLTFVGVTPHYLAVGGYELLTIHADRHDGRLHASWRAYGMPAAARDTILFDEIAAVEFGYFGSTASGEPARWHPAWHDQPLLPALVRLHIVRRDGRTMPELVVAPRIGSDVP